MEANPKGVTILIITKIDGDIMTLEYKNTYGGEVKPLLINRKAKTLTNTENNKITPLSNYKISKVDDNQQSI